MRKFIQSLSISVPEFLLLWGLWMGLVSNPHRSEMLAGLAAAAVAAVADAVVKTHKLVQFVPRISWLALIFLEPWYVLQGTWKIFVALARRLLGRHSEAELKAVRFDPGSDDDASQARRALAITYISLPPQSYVLGIDRKRGLMLAHHIAPAPASFLERKLGVKE